MTTHSLKCWPSMFDAIARGEKTCEVRSNLDRDFHVGDLLLLRRWDPEITAYGGSGKGGYVRRPGMCVWGAEDADTIEATVTHVLHGGRFGVPVGICVLSFAMPEDQPAMVVLCDLADALAEGKDGA